MEYIYFLKEWGNNNVVKIGRTTNLKQRIKKLQTGNSKKLYYYKTSIVNDNKLIEKQLHEKCKDKCIRDEWFYLTNQEIKHILNVFQLN